MMTPRVASVALATLAAFAGSACYESHLALDEPDAASPSCEAPVDEQSLGLGQARSLAVHGCDRVAALGEYLIRSEDGGRSFEALELNVPLHMLPAMSFSEDGALHLVQLGEAGVSHLVAKPGAEFGAERLLLGPASTGARIAGPEPRAHHAIAPFGDGVIVGAMTEDPPAAYVSTATSEGAVATRRLSAPGDQKPGVARVCAAAGVAHAVYVDWEGRAVFHASGRALAELDARLLRSVGDAAGTGFRHADLACFDDGAALVIHIDGIDVFATPVSAEGVIGDSVVVAQVDDVPFYPHVETLGEGALVTWSAASAVEMGWVIVTREGEAVAEPRIAPDLGGEGLPDARPVHCATAEGYALLAQSGAAFEGAEPPTHGLTQLSAAGEELDHQSLGGPALNTSLTYVACTRDGAWVLPTRVGEPLVLRHFPFGR
jgi:hypothetical protein